MSRICSQCGTEVDEDALFCPTCGQPIDSTAAPDLPPAPDWPELPARRASEEVPAEVAGSSAEVPAAAGETPDEAPSPASLPDATVAMPSAAPTVDRTSAPEPPAIVRHETVVTPASPAGDEPSGPGQATHGWERPSSESPVPPWRRGAAHRAEVDAGAASEQRNAPVAPSAGAPSSVAPAPDRLSGVVQVPELLSDWLAGLGALLATIAMFLPWVAGGTYTTGWGLASGVNLLFTLVLLGVLTIVFGAHYLPRIPQRSLVVLAVGLVGVGIGLDRLGLPVTGAGGTIFLIATVAIAVGGAMAQLGYDRPVGGPEA